MASVPLSSPDWPDLTDLFDLTPEKEPWFNFSQQQAGTPGFNPQIYAKPPLTLINQGLTQNQAALLSPNDQLIAKS